MCVGSLDHLDNCKSLIYLKACLKMVIFSTYVRRSLPFVSRFTSILMLEGNQLRLVHRNQISILIVIDDLMKDATNSKDVCELFIEGSHHRNISVACILQNGFSKGKENRTMSINTQYIVLFKNPREFVKVSFISFVVCLVSGNHGFKTQKQ